MEKDVLVMKEKKPSFVDKLLGGKTHSTIVSIMFFSFLILFIADLVMTIENDIFTIFLFTLIVSCGAYTIFRILFTFLKNN